MDRVEDGYDQPAVYQPVRQDVGQGLGEWCRQRLCRASDGAAGAAGGAQHLESRCGDADHRAGR